MEYVCSDLVARGLTGMRLVTFDALPNLVYAVPATLIQVTPNALWPAVKLMLHSAHEQPDRDHVHAEVDHLLDYAEANPPSLPPTWMMPGAKLSR